MAPRIYSPLYLAIFLSLTLAAFNALAQQDDHHPSAMEIAQLPRFCWKSFGVPNAEGPEFHIPPASDCGWGMNHYCLGLVDLVRVRNGRNKGERTRWLGLADANVRYTENAMKGFPSCSLREHVAASRAEVNKFILLYRGKLPKAQ